jgi:hypothetical protein
MKSIYVFVWIATLAAVPAQAGTCPGILAHPAVQQLAGEITNGQYTPPGWGAIDMATAFVDALAKRARDYDIFNPRRRLGDIPRGTNPGKYWGQEREAANAKIQELKAALARMIRSEQGQVNLDTFKACFPQMVELMKVTPNQKKQEETQQAEMATESATGTNDIAVTVEKVEPAGIIRNGKCVVLQGDTAEEIRQGRIKGVPDDQWCNAIRVITKDINRTSFLRYFVTCTVYGSSLTVLGKGASSISAPDMYTNQTPDFGELSSFGKSASIIRIPNVKLDSVVRVECRASRR